MRVLSGWLSLATFLAPALSAQTQGFTGTYGSPSQTGGTVLLVLQQSPDGAVSGTLSSDAVSFSLSGSVQAGVAQGTVAATGARLFFSAALLGETLTLTLVEPGPDGRPNPAASQSIPFTRQSNAAANTPAPPPVNTPRPPSVPAGGGAAETFAGWNVSYRVPSGWSVGQRVGRVHQLMGGPGGSLVYVGPGMYQTFNDVAVDLTKGFQALGLQGMPSEQPVPGTVRGMQSMSVSFTGSNRSGTPLEARATAVLTPHGTGLIVLGIAPQGQLAMIRGVVDQVAQSLEALGPPQPNSQIIAALRGRWMAYAGKADGTTSASGGSSRSSEETVEFDGQGRFSYQSSSSVSVTTPGLTGTAGGAQSTNNDGTYTVIGNTLVIRGRQGQMSFDLQMQNDRIIADGKTYLRAN